MKTANLLHDALRCLYRASKTEDAEYARNLRYIARGYLRDLSALLDAGEPAPEVDESAGYGVGFVVRGTR
jgi:hypothetical protein